MAGSSRHRRMWGLAGGALVAVLALAAPRPGAAQVGSDRYSSIVMEASTGNVLSAANADEPRYPASLTKMMTLYMLFEALRDRRVSLNQYVPVSAWAAGMSPSKLGLQPGTLVTVEQCLLGLVTKSANDAAAALGEMLGGDEERFAQMMTLRARSLGMTRTTFRNASGLPDWDQVTTARDMATLGRRLAVDFPVYYQYFSTPQFVWHGRVIPNHDRMLESYPGADGLKTGWIQASGHNLATSAVRNGVRLVGVVLGAGSQGERDQHMTALLDQGYDMMGVAPVYASRRAPTWSLPQFVGSAEAAPVETRVSAERVRVQWAGAHALRYQPRAVQPVAQGLEIPARSLRRAAAPSYYAPPGAERVRAARPVAASAEPTKGRPDARPAHLRPMRVGSYAGRAAG